jgi:hypothetical protein
VGNRATALMYRTLTWIGWGLIFAAMLTWAMPVTWLLFRPQHVEIIGDQVILHRHFPGDAIGLPRPIMLYVETVKPLTVSHNNGHRCQHSPQSPFRYSSAELVGRWSIDWAEPCLSDAVGFVWEARWTAYVGAIPLGPVSLSATILRDPCQYLVSTRGIVHGPDSPYRDTVARNGGNCFPTQSAAEAYAEGMR